MRPSDDSRSESQHITESRYVDWRTDRTPVTWWERVLDGDSTAWEKLVRVWTPCIADKCRRMGLGAEDVRDVTQLVLIRVHRFGDRFSRSRPGHRLKHWLLKIINQAVAEHYRRFSAMSHAAGGDDHAARLADIAEADSRAGDSECAAGQEVFDPVVWMQCTLEVLERELPPQTWEIFKLFKLEGLSGKEVEARTGVSEGAIRVRVHSVVKRLKREGEDLFDAPPID